MRSLAALAVLFASSAALAAVPEGQPTSTAYPNHKSYVYGSDSQPYNQSFYRESPFITVDDYYVFEPRSGSEIITSAPVVVFIHGYGMDGPGKLDKLIRHLTRSGMTVVYPTYLNYLGNGTNFADWVNRTYTSIQRALAKLGTAGHVPVQTDASGRAKMAFVSHSIGTYVSAFVAEKAADLGGIPQPLAMVMTDPAGYDTKGIVGIDMTQIGNIHPATEVVLLSANDTLYNDQGGVASHTQYAVRDFVTYLPVTCDRVSAWVVASDSEAGTRLVSDHNGGPATQVFDAIDWWGYWPHISAHLKHAFWGTYGSFLHNGDALFSGTWRDSSGYIRDINPKFPHPIYPAGYGCP